MKFPGIQRIARGVAIALSVSFTAAGSFAVLLDNGFKQTGPGDFDFENPANWHAGVVDGVFAHIPSGVQSIVFNAASPNPANGLTFSLGGVSPTLTLRGAGAGGQTLTLLGDVRVLGSNGAAITIGAMETNKTLNLELADDRTFQVEATNTLTIVNSIIDNEDGYGITKTGGGRLVLVGAADFRGGTQIVEGTLEVAGENALWVGGEVSVGGGATFAVAANQTLARIDGRGAVEIGSGVELKLFTGQDLIFDGTISGLGSLRFHGDDGGTLTLKGANTYEGGTWIEAGAVYLDSQFALGTAADVSIGGEATVLLRADQTFATLSGGPGAGVVFAEDEMPAFVPTMRVLTIAGNEDSNFGGSISGYGKLVKLGAGTLTLTDESDYSGGTWVSGGKLVVTNFSGSATGAGAVTVDAGAELQIGNGSSGMGGVDGTIANHGVVTFNQLLGTYAGGIAGTGQVRIAPWSSVTFDGAHGFVGGTTVEEHARLVLNHAGGNTLATSGDVTLRDGSVLEVNFDQTVRGVISASTTSGIEIAGGKTLTVNLPTGASELFAGTILGAGGLQKNGPGTLVLSGASTYEGGTRIRGGVLFANNESGSATGAGLVEVLNGGILAGTGTILGAVEVDFGGAIAPAAGLGTPGKMTVGSTTLGGGGEFAFQIADADGDAGTDYSLLAISGQLAIASTAMERFAIQMYSVGLDGAVANFDPAQAYSWMFVTTTGGIAGFDPAKFEFNLEEFSVTLAGSFSVSQWGDNLLINYSPAAIPEPSTWMLLGGGLAVVMVMLKRKRKGR